MSLVPAHLSDALLAKFFFVRGCGYVPFGTAFDTGLAVSLFQDAAEIAAQAATKIVGAKPGATFLDHWNQVAQAGKPAPRDMLPMKTEMTQLNMARVNFKHHGNPPAYADGFQRDVERFLRKVFADFLGEDFDAVSQADMIGDAGIRKEMKAAEEAINEGKPEIALHRCADALRIAYERRMNFGDPGLDVQFNNVPPEVAQEIRLHFGNVWNHLRHLRELTFAGLFGMNILDVITMRELVPRKQGPLYVFREGVKDSISLDRSAAVVRIATEYCARLSDHLVSTIP